ncbi:MAG: hypothetical protein ACYC46_10575 [Acidobacteriaceae bacterium]
MAVLVLGLMLSAGIFSLRASSQLADAKHLESAAFPALQATNLARQPMQLPQDFAGKRNLLLIAFTREQQRDVDSWIPAARKLEQQYPELRYYELPTLARNNPLFRWWVNSAMRSGIPEEQARERTITLYLDKKNFRRKLGIANEKQISVLLIDASGKVLARTTGSYTPQKQDDFVKILNSAH